MEKESHLESGGDPLIESQIMDKSDPLDLDQLDQGTHPTHILNITPTFEFRIVEAFD